MLTIDEIKDIVTRVGAKYGVKNVYLFGSYARGEATANSDVDLIIDRGKLDNYMKKEEFRLELTGELGTEVDLISDKWINPRFFELIKNDRILLYGA